MYPLLSIIIILVVVYYFVSRGIPRLISWVINVRYRTEIHIGRLSVFPLYFEDVLIKKSGLSIKIEKVGVTSSLFNQEEWKIIALQVQDVRVEKEVNDQRGSPFSGDHENFTSSDFEEDFIANEINSDSDGSPQIEIKISPSMVTLAQFFGMHISSMTIMYLREKWPECLLHASAEKITVEGATLNQTNIALNVVVSGAHVKVLQHVPEREVRSPGGLMDDPSLMECTVSLKVFVEAKAETIAATENVSVVLNEPQVKIRDRLLTFLDDKASTAVIARKSHTTKSHNSDFKNVLKRYWLFVPLKTSVNVEKVGLKFVSSIGQSALKGTLSAIEFHTHLTRDGDLENFPTVLPDLSTELSFENICIQGTHDSTISFNKFIHNSQFGGDRIDMKMEVRSPHINYDYRDLNVWTNYRTRRKVLTSCQSRLQENVGVRRESDNNKTLHQYTIGLIFEVWDVWCGVQLPGSPKATISLQHARQSIVLGAGGMEVGGELVLESLSGSVGATVRGDTQRQASRRIHMWGAPASAGLVIVQVTGLPMQGAPNIMLQAEAMLDNLQLEWNNNLAEFIIGGMKYINELKQCFRHQSLYAYRRTEPVKEENRWSSVAVNCANINVFAHTQQGVSLMARVDSLEIKWTSGRSITTVKGTKCQRFVPAGTHYNCIKSSEVKGEFGLMKEASIENVGGEILLNAGEQLQLIWSSTTHMMILTLVEEIKGFITDLRYLKDNSRWGSIENSNPSVNLEGDYETTSTSLQLQLIANGDVRIGAILSKKHQMFFKLGDITYLMAHGRISCQTEELQIHFDDHQIITLTGAKLARTLLSKEVKEERESFPELTQKQNRAWKLTLDTWTTTFPHQYYFSEAFSDSLMSVVKWIKYVHNIKPKVFTAESSLPADLVIRVRKWVMEVCDDPFEVKLRYNYELIEDEYQESCKRLKALNDRIEELRKTVLFIPAGKIEALYKSLQEKNCQTYIKRSKQMYESAPMRTQLFTWTMEDVVIFAMADPTFHGTANVVQHMQDIDPDTPWPEDRLEFNTLWCRLVSASCAMWKFQLRDYPQCLLDMTDLEIWGRLIGAEQKATKRAHRTVIVEVDSPWTNVSIERSMTALKFYHDFSCEVKSFTAAYGPCWEPAVSQVSLAFNLISKTSQDPSMPLPWWDKMRLLLHGRLTLMVERMTLLLHASLDPYNTTEEMELTWTDLTMDWTNAKLIFKGDLNVYVRTASKYDDARLLHLPNLKLTVKLHWICRGNPNDHHIVMPCAPDKLPEYSSNQEHDSYRVFRSQNLNMNIGLETRTQKKEDTIITPVIEALFYGSTLRWFENLKFILSGVTRPTRRGPLFNNTHRRKPQLSRHYSTIHLSLSFQRFDVRYWMSVGVKKGFHLSGERLSLSSEHTLTLVPITDGLKHRPRSCWSIAYLNTELTQAQVWLQSVMKELQTVSDQTKGNPMPQPVEKFYFINVTKVAYMRETLTPTMPGTAGSASDPSKRETPDHRLVVYDLKGAWTTNNRDIVFALYDSWTKSQQLRRNLAPDIIKSFKLETTSTPQKPRSRSLTENVGQSLTSPTASLQVPPVQATPSPMSRLQSGHAQALLQQLIAEVDNNQVAFSEDCSNTEQRDNTLHGVKACTTDDVIHKKWLIELVNSQVLLKGCETKGYVILSAAKAQIVQRIHRPVWREDSLVTKTTWFGSLECMQYYATVSGGDKETQMDNIMWLTLDNIEQRDGQVINDVPDIVGSGQSVGGVVSQTVGASDEGNESLQLQRIVSRCRCEFYYVSYGETGLDPALLEEVQPPSSDDELWSRNVEAVDTFTLMHHDLSAYTNSLQYNMVVDILNNLLLYVDPKKKQASSALARMRFQLQIDSREDHRKPIVKLQNQVRYLLSHLRLLEKELYLLQRQLDKDGGNQSQLSEKASLENQVSECKEQLNTLSEELAMRIHCYNETQLTTNHKLTSVVSDKKARSIRMNEVCFRKAQWRLTESDGQLGIADLVLSNFLYTKKTNSDDGVEHLLELGYVNMRNLLPNQIYVEVLNPSELQMMPVDRQRTLRIFCREKPPCGGIAIIEHFEINVVPLNIALTYQFFKTMMKFCFPDNATEEEHMVGPDNTGPTPTAPVAASGSTRGGKRQASLRKSYKESSFYVSLSDVEIMRQRAEQNKMFVYIKIPEVPVRVSYKGKKGIEDVSNFRLVVPTLEYHNVTWTWLDFLMAMKQDSKTALLSQVFKQKLKLAPLHAYDAAAPNEEEKARLLLGDKLMPPENKGSKKSLFKFNR
ncbi:bridge-like lipid transfer protein family member hobbit isoform X2 [Oratosquilla oratoria]|uniref:bridge-like lipid transfer protein family member hobbit isoform X2 n=1 Tax=Oratosquilla oratoria TaxID=337810 RepID=UPI003F76DE0A